MQTWRILVVGCGSIGRRHLTVLAERPEVELAVCEPLPVALVDAARLVPRAARFAALDEALAWRPNIVVVATPNASHRAVAERGLAAGAHVLCEKPIADTVADGQAMVAAAAAHGKVLAVGYSERYRPSLEFVQRQAVSGALGNLVGGRAMVGTYNTLLCAKTDFRQRVFGALLVDYTHELDFLRWIFGDVVEVVARGHSLGAREKRCQPSLAALVLTFASGALVSVHMDYIQHPQRRVLEVYGDRQALELDMQTDALRIYDSATEGFQTRYFDPERNNRFRAEHQDMIDAVGKGTRPRVTGEDGVKALAIAESAIAQIRATGRD